jgi:hypothetical protein
MEEINQIRNKNLKVVPKNNFWKKKKEVQNLNWNVLIGDQTVYGD